MVGADLRLRDCENLLRFYVYVLIDSGTDQVFYVGKGSGQRVFSHMKQWRKGAVDNSDKFRRITEIHKAGDAVLERCVADDLDEHDAYELERQLIHSIGIDNLTNINDGAGRKCKPKTISAKLAEYLSRRATLRAAERAKFRKECNITVESLHQELDEAFQMARLNNDLAGMNKAIVAKSHIAII